MLTPYLEMWRSRMQGSDPMHPELSQDPFYSQMLTELNDLSNTLERIKAADDIAVVQRALESLMQRHKPTGNAPDPDVCPRCGKKYP